MSRGTIARRCDRRELLKRLCSVGSMACLGCSGMALASEDAAPDGHPFQAPSEMSFEEVFRFAYASSFIPTMKVLAERVGLETIQTAACDSAADEVRRTAASLPSRGLADWAASLTSPTRFWKHVLIYDVVEDSADAFEVRVSECLWATTFRSAGAAELGYSWVCHPDFAMARAFNPKMRLRRDSTLMQGGPSCNHRWEIET